jgi:hypothetical protein
VRNDLPHYLCHGHPFDRFDVSSLSTIVVARTLIDISERAYLQHHPQSLVDAATILEMVIEKKSGHLECPFRQFLLWQVIFRIEWDLNVE